MKDNVKYEPSLGKTNNVVSEQVRQKPTCTVTEKKLKLEISDFRRRGNVLVKVKTKFSAKLICVFGFP